MSLDRFVTPTSKKQQVTVEEIDAALAKYGLKTTDFKNEFVFLNPDFPQMMNKSAPSIEHAAASSLWFGFLQGVCIGLHRGSKK